MCVGTGGRRAPAPSKVALVILYLLTLLPNKSSKKAASSSPLGVGQVETLHSIMNLSNALQLLDRLSLSLSINMDQFLILNLTLSLKIVFTVIGILAMVNHKVQVGVTSTNSNAKGVEELSAL